jgi:integrase
LEPNLYRHPKGFRWKHPITGRFHYLGKDASVEFANQTARALNSLHMPKTSIFDRIAGAESESLRAVIELYLRERLPILRIAARTRKNYEYALRRLLKADIAARDVSTVTTRDIVAYLKSLASDSLRQQYRAHLNAVFKTAIQEGLIKHNPVTDTDAPHVERERERLMQEGYCIVYAAADAWMRNLMDLMRLTLQRPEDLLSLRWEAFTGTHLRVKQGKTGKRLAIVVRPEIRQVLERCRDHIASPYIVHRLPQRLNAKGRRSASKDNHTQILRPEASRAFTAIVRRCDYFTGHPKPPTLYECKALGIAQLRGAGWPMEEIQRLAGHRSVRMTEHYAKGHDTPFDEVGADPFKGSGFVTEVLP